MKLYAYTVQGSAPFPVDMLRYDASWPKDDLDSMEITDSIEHDRGLSITIDLVGLKPPAEARWRSFGWKATKERETG